MPITSKRIIASGPHMDGDIAQAERLLQHMQRIHSHDLPNQMVALQSLLQLLSFEESQNLSPEGREYVRRLQNAARRAGDLVRFLKDIGRLNSYACVTESIVLGNLSRELQGELQRAFPEKQFTFDWQWHVPAIVGDPRVFLHAILELSKVLFAGPKHACLIQAESRRHGDVVELAFQIQEPPTAAMDCGNSPIPLAAWSERMEVVLAREWLALCGGVAELTLKVDGEAAFLIAVSNRRE